MNRMMPAWKDEGVGDWIRPVFFSHAIPGKYILEQVEREDEERGPRAAKFSHRLELWDLEKQSLMSRRPAGSGGWEPGWPGRKCPSLSGCRRRKVWLF